MEKLFASERGCIRAALRGSPSTGEMTPSDLGTTSRFLRQPRWITSSFLSRVFFGLLLLVLNSPTPLGLTESIRSKMGGIS
jgi:hypothetical protein